MTSDEGTFWDHRYRAEGAIWGEGPSATAVLAAPYLAAGARVLDIGSGYGRDLVHLGKSHCRLSAAEVSEEGHRLARQRLAQSGLEADLLFPGPFERMEIAEGAFDAVLSHRMAHLLITAAAIDVFVAKLHRALRTGGILAVGARNLDDLVPDAMIRLQEHVYSYRHRPGHVIRYWGDCAFQQAFGNKFSILHLTHTTEIESCTNPVPCHLTVMIGRKKSSGDC